MKIVIFAGGVGTRLWPVSREKTPKQFERIIGEKSTLQLSAERLLPDYHWQDLYICTGEKYQKIVQNQLPNLPEKNIICEPIMRDVGPAVGLMAAVLSSKFSREPVAILWSDHLLKNIKNFKKALKHGEKIIKKEQYKIIFFGEKPRFSSQNLGWIKSSKRGKFLGWHYRPDKKTAEKYYQSGDYLWNPGYFITSPEFIMDAFARYQPGIYKKLLLIQKFWHTKKRKQILSETYPQITKISFDNAILEKLPSEGAYVLRVNLGWSDIGAWESLKEALQKSDLDNVIRGHVINWKSSDCLVYNYKEQLVVTVGLKGVLVVNTPDALLVCPKDKVPEIKKMVERLKNDKGHQKYF